MDDDDKKLLRQVLGVLQAKQAHLAERVHVHHVEIDTRINALEEKIKKIQAKLEWC